MLHFGLVVFRPVRSKDPYGFFLILMSQKETHALVRKVATFFAKRPTFSTKSPLFCALSGGADSVALACALHALDLPFAALHVNFMLRGAESERDEDFVRSFCAARGIPLSVRRFDTRAATEHGESIEMVARRLRYAWFAEQKGPVCVAHHADDQAETVLLNLVRGSGLRGLAAMREENDAAVWRPLLGVRRREILDYLAAEGQTYVTDSTNADTYYRRNFVRRRLLPLLGEMNPSVVDTLADTAARLREALSVYEIGLSAVEARIAVERYDRGESIALDDVRRQGAAGREWLRRRLAGRGFSDETAGRALAAREGAWFEGKEGVATVHGDRLVCAPLRPRPLPEWTSAAYERSGDFVPSREASRITIDAERVSGELHLRRLREGDRFVPFGFRRGSKLVSDYLTDRKRSRIDKRDAAVLCDAVGIVCLVGETVDRRVAVTAATRRILEIKFQPHER